MKTKDVKEGLEKRAFKNWKTSLMGLVLLIIASVALMTGKATLTEVGLFLPTCFGLIYVQDSIFNVNPKK